MTVAILIVSSLILQQLSKDFYQQAVVAFQQGSFDQVISLLDKLHENEMERPAAYNLKALALAGLQRYDEALIANHRAQGLDPTSANYVYNAGLILLTKENLQDSEQCFRKGIDRFPRSAELHRGLGEVLFELNRFQEAEQWLGKAAEIDPVSAPAHVLFAKLFYALGDRRSFGTAATKAVQLDPQSHLACYYYGIWLIEDQQRFQEGKEYIQKSVALSPKFVEGIKQWAGILTREGNLAEAARMYEKAITIDPKDARIFYVMAGVYRKLGQHAKAEAALAEYKKARP